MGKEDIPESVGLGRNYEKPPTKKDPDILTFIIKFATPLGLLIFSLGTMILLLTR